MRRLLTVLLGSVVAISPLYLTRITLADVPIYLPEWPLLAAALVWLLARPSLPVVPLPRLLGWLIVAFLAVATLSSLVNGLETVGALKSWVVMPTLYGYLVYQLLAIAPREWPILRRFVIGAVLAVAGLALYQALTGAVRPSSFFNSPNAAAMWLVPMYFVATHRLNAKTSWVLGLITFTALIVTRSEGALAAFIVGATVWWLAAHGPVQKQSQKIVGAGFLLVAIATLTPWLDTGLNTIFGDLLGARIQIWEVARMALISNPLLGIGPGGFEDYYFSHVGSVIATPLEWAVPQPHSLYLATAVAIGVPGLIILLFVIVVAGYNQITNQRPVLTAALAAIATHGLVDTQYWKNDLALIFFLVIALSALPRSEQA